MDILKCSNSRLIACLLAAVVMVFGFSGAAYAATGPQTYFSYGGVDYHGAATIQFSGSYAYGSAMTVASKTVPAGQIGVGAWVYENDKMGAVNYSYPSWATTVASVTASQTKRSGFHYRAEGLMAIWTGSSYRMPSLSSSPTMTASLSQYSVLPNGLTYGSSVGVKSFDEFPDLIEAVTPFGATGYVSKTSLESVMPDNPEEAVALSTSGTVTSVPVQDLSGNTVGTLPVRFTAESADLFAMEG